jgi:hypothetical protein
VSLGEEQVLGEVEGGGVGHRFVGGEVR